MITLFDQTYYDHSLSDLPQDIMDCFNPAYNAAVVAIPVNENGSQMGHYRVRVEWIDG